MRTIKIIFEDGDYVITRINASVEEIENYYLGKHFNLRSSGARFKKCVSIEYLDEDK